MQSGQAFVAASQTNIQISDQNNVLPILGIDRIAFQAQLRAIQQVAIVNKMLLPMNRIWQRTLHPWKNFKR